MTPQPPQGGFFVGGSEREPQGNTPMPQYDIRPARPADLPQILGMIRALSAFHDDTAAITLEALQEALFTPHRATAFVADAGDKLVGYAGIVFADTLHTGKPRVDIHHLYIDDGFRNHGIGSGLISAATSLAANLGAQGVTIGTDPNNLTAQAAYRAMGLEEITDAGPRFWTPVA